MSGIVINTSYILLVSGTYGSGGTANGVIRKNSTVNTAYPTDKGFRYYIETIMYRMIAIILHIDIVDMVEHGLAMEEMDYLRSVGDYL